MAIAVKNNRVKACFTRQTERPKEIAR